MKATLCGVALAAALVLSCLTGAQRAAAQVVPPADAIEEPARLNVTISGKAYMLEALIVRRPGEGRLPVALITHGANPGNPRGADLDWLRGWAHEFAHRGWLAVAVMRRGYGTSEGEVADDAGTCASPEAGRYLDAHADDLEAALRSIARRPDADMGRVLAMGNSAGGAAVMALAARNAVPLAGVVNVSGGLTKLGPFRLDPACAPYESDLVWNFARFGAAARMPTLWLYAENDSFFRPGLVSRMRAAFTGSGGRADLVTLPPFRDDGHTMFFAPGGRRLLLPELDRFLRTNGLPTWDEAVFAPLLARLSSKDRQGVEDYLRLLPVEKALALAPAGGVYWSQSRPTGDDARTEVLAYCKQQVGADCTLAAVNFHPLDPATQHATTDR